MAIKVTALVSVKPGSEEAFEAVLPSLTAGSRAEPGNLRYDVWREADGERRYVFDELYADGAAVKAHMASDHFKAFGAAIGGLVTAPPLIVASKPMDVA